MKTPNIDQLIEKYWAGDSSIQEEQIIKDYFASSEVRDEHLEIAPLFDYFRTEANIETEKNYSESLDDKKQSNVFNLSNIIRSIAAIFAIAICAYVGYEVGQEAKNQNQMMAYEIEDPEKALEVTKQALAMLSTKLNDQTQSLSNDMQMVESANIFK